VSFAKLFPGAIIPVAAIGSQNLFPRPCRKAMHLSASKIKLLSLFYCTDFGIVGGDSLADKRSKFLFEVYAIKPKTLSNLNFEFPERESPIFRPLIMVPKKYQKNEKL
jgi:hypothetical protein